MSNDDVNAVVLRLARTLQRCGEDPSVVFAALIGAAATLGADCGVEVDEPEELQRAIDSIMRHGELRGLRKAALNSAAVIAFPAPRAA